jgi:hypothetical protein
MRRREFFTLLGGAAENSTQARACVTQFTLIVNDRVPDF